jgi:formamidopyrimidine-DNA glycosylase
VPELPEVETVVRKIRPRLVGRRFTGAPLASPLMIADPRFAERLMRTSVRRLDRQGKWMFARLSSDETLVVHLGMTGRFGVMPAHAAVEKHTHVRLRLDDGAEEMRFVDPRRFGEFFVADADEFDRRFGPRKLGPDALTATLQDLKIGLAKTTRTTKSALLDQRLIAGVGNIYADEILHRAGVPPTARADRLPAEAVANVHRAMRRVLTAAIRAEGTTIHSFLGADGAMGKFQLRLRVYGRRGEPCLTCGAEIRWTDAAASGRSSYWCPRCQPSPRAARRRAARR